MKWSAPEYEYREKTVAWYWISIIIAAVIVAFSVWQKNFLFGLFIVVAEILFIIWGDRAPHILDFRLTEGELEIGERKQYSLKDMGSMSVDELSDEWTEIIFVSKAKLKTPVKILIPEGRLQELRTNLKTLLKEVPYEPTLLDSIEKLLRF